MLIHMLQQITPDARVFTIDTGVLFPETYATWRELEQKTGVKVEVLDATSADGTPVERRATAAARTRSRRSSARWTAWTPGSPACAASSRPPAPTPASPSGTSRTGCGSSTRWRTGPRRTSGTTSPSTTCPTTRCTTRATPRSAARRAPCPAAAARAAGPARRRPSAACTWSRDEHHRHTPGADAPRGAGVRGDPRVPRGRGRAGEPGAAVQRRQGLDRAAAPGREGVPPRQVPVPGDARGHGPQLRRGDRVPRPARGRAGRAADRGLGAGDDRLRPRHRGDRPARLAQPAPDHHAAGRHRGATASTPPSAAPAATRSAPGPRSA